MKIDHPWVETIAPNTFVLRFPPERTVEQTEAMWNALTAAYEADPAPGAFGWIFDLAHMKSSQAGARARMAAHVKSHHDYLDQYCLGLAVVVRSALTRGVVQAVSWLIPNKPAPFKTVESVEAGKAWLDKQRAKSAAA